MHLILMPESEDDKETHYGFPDLQNLQSKLMLVAGKAAQGKDNVDTFTEVKCIAWISQIYLKGIKPVVVLTGVCFYRCVCICLCEHKDLLWKYVKSN